MDADCGAIAGSAIALRPVLCRQGAHEDGDGQFPADAAESAAFGPFVTVLSQS
jgi:hypothetical protein